VFETVRVCETLGVPITCGPKTSPAALKVRAGEPTTPVPLRVTELLARKLLLLVTDKFPLATPFCVGKNAMLIVQLAPGASEPGQLLAWVKLGLIRNAEVFRVRLVLPILPTETVCVGLAVPTVWVPKVNVEGVRVMKGWLTPVPFRVITMGLLLPVKLIVSVPGRAPVVVGLKVTLKVHSPPPARLEPQVLVSE